MVNNNIDLLKEEDLQFCGYPRLGTGIIAGFFCEKTGEVYFFKYAISRHSDRELQPYKANKSECGYLVQKLVDENTAVPCKTMVIDGHYGSIQEVMPHAEQEYDLVSWQETGYPDLPKCAIDDLLREFITDYLLCNFDGHPKNFFTREDGRIIGVDKEQAFKYMNEPEASELSYTYHPNAKYREREPIYNTIFRRFAHGELEVDFTPVLKLIKKIQKVDNAEYRKIFEKNVEMNPNLTFTTDEFLDRIVERKEQFLSKFTKFLGALEAERAKYLGSYSSKRE